MTHDRQDKRQHWQQDIENWKASGQSQKVYLYLSENEKAVFIDDVEDQDQPAERRIVAAKRPQHPLNKCIASIQMLAYIIIAKYCDGLSPYTLENILKRYGGNITRTAMANWVIRLSVELQPLINLARDHQLSYDYLQIETALAVPEGLRRKEGAIHGRPPPLSRLHHTYQYLTQLSRVQLRFLR